MQTMMCDGIKKRVRWLMAAVLLATLQGACGSPTGPDGPTRTQVGQGTFTLTDSNTAILLTGGADFVAVNLSTTIAGTLDLTVDWTSPANDLDVYLLRGTCNPSQAVSGVCGSPFSQSESSTAKPERLSVGGLAAGSYTLVISSNPGNSAESGSFQIFLTH